MGMREVRMYHRYFGVLLTGLGTCFGIAGAPGFEMMRAAYAQKPAANTVRPEIGKPIRHALDLLKRKRAKSALAKVREAEAVPNKTPYEAYLVERVRGQVAAAAGNALTAARAFEATAANSAVSGAERLQFLAAAAGQYYMTKNYAKVVEICARYFKDGGSDKAVRTLYVQALYLGSDFAAASKELLRDVQAEERAGRAPPEDQLQLLANAYLKQGDSIGYRSVLERFVTYYPKNDYWLALIHNVVGARSGFSERLSLDWARFRLATGTMRNAADYIEAAQLSLQAGLPAEATKIIDQGYAAGLLGGGPESERHRRLKEMAIRNLAEDKKALGQDDAAVAELRDGTALLNAGLNYVLHGAGAKGLAMMNQGLRKAGLKHPDDARLRLGYAYQLSGQKQKAIQVFKSIRAKDGAAALAHLWLLHLGRGG